MEALLLFRDEEEDGGERLKERQDQPTKGVLFLLSCIVKAKEGNCGYRPCPNQRSSVCR